MAYGSVYVWYWLIKSQWPAFMMHPILWIVNIINVPHFLVPDHEMLSTNHYAWGTTMCNNDKNVTQNTLHWHTHKIYAVIVYRSYCRLHAALYGSSEPFRCVVEGWESVYEVPSTCSWFCCVASHLETLSRRDMLGLLPRSLSSSCMIPDVSFGTYWKVSWLINN